jgi:hypothetical protein
MVHPQTQAKPASVHRVKFFDGPLAGQTKDYPAEHPTFTEFGWTYEATGKRDGDHWLYVLLPRGRRLRSFIRFLAKERGEDPRLTPKDEPMKVAKRGRNEPCWCGSGKKYKRCHGC